jgi:RNA polymerase sigma-70 factor (ECF subfamily)
LVAFLERAQRGDRKALQQLFCYHLPLLSSWARRKAPEWIRRRGETDDLVQRTVLNALRRLKHLDPAQEDQLQGYLRRSLINLIRDDFRRAQRHPPSSPLDENAISWAPSPLRRTLAREEMRRYQSALARLTPRSRAAIVGRFERGLSYERLAGVLGRPTAGAARIAVTRSVAALHREMRRPAPRRARRTAGRVSG